MGSDVRLIVEAALCHRLHPRPQRRPSASAATSRTSPRGSRAFAPTASCARSTRRARRRCRPRSCCAQRSPRDCGRRSASVASSTRRSPARSRRPATQSSLEDAAPASLREALASAPPRRAGPAPRRRALAAGRRSTTRRGTCAVRWACASTRAARARASPPTRSPTVCAATRRFVVDCGGDIAVGGVGAQVDPVVDRGRASAHRRVRRTRCSSRGGGVATSGLNVRIWRRADGDVRPPPARSLERRAGVERPDRGDGARAERARGRDALEARAARRAPPARARHSRATVAWSCTTTATSS